jgi:lactate dehydrogenase-like 2-hydroxyacid dehydrogenase
MSVEPEPLTTAEEFLAEEPCEGKTLRVIGWFSIGMAVAAIGIFVGREIRSRYKFKRRTPYDFYANAGEKQAGEFGMGI